MKCSRITSSGSRATQARSTEPGRGSAASGSTEPGRGSAASGSTASGGTESRSRASGSATEEAIAAEEVVAPLPAPDELAETAEDIEAQIAALGLPPDYSPPPPPAEGGEESEAERGGEEDAAPPSLAVDVDGVYPVRFCDQL